jgi:SAM-dependent methyltransferase
VDVPSNWFESFFHGVAVDLWLQAVPPEHTREEAARLERRLELTPGAEVLDVPCGAGRVALELAARGYILTGVDLSAESLAHARAASEGTRRPDGAGPVRWEHRDMRDLPWPGRFDAAFCTGNSFGYLSDEGDLAFLQAVATALKPGGRFALETPMVIESLLPSLKDRPWFKAGDIYLLVANEYDAARGRLDIEYTFASPAGIEVRRGTHRAYTYRQLIELMETAGFDVTVEPGWPANSTLTLLGRRR